MEQAIIETPDIPLFILNPNSLILLLNYLFLFQILSIAEQLDAGVRYFDIRLAKFRSALYGENGLYSGQLKKYLKVDSPYYTIVQISKHIVVSENTEIMVQ